MISNFRLTVTTATGLACFPHELVVTPEAFAFYKYANVVQYSHLPIGGHFAAFEQPALMAKDIKSFIEKTEKQRLTNQRTLQDKPF